MPCSLGLADQPAEVGEGAELGVDGGVPALGGADAPRAADVVRLGGRAVVLPLAERPADRVDRRQVEHVEPHPGDARELGLHVPKRAVLARFRRPRPRKQLVPRAEPGLRPGPRRPRSSFS